MRQPRAALPNSPDQQILLGVGDLVKGIMVSIAKMIPNGGQEGRN